MCVCASAYTCCVYKFTYVSRTHTHSYIPDRIDEVMKPNCIPHFALDFDHNGFILCNKLMDLLMNENDQFIGKRDRNPVISTANYLFTYFMMSFDRNCKTYFLCFDVQFFSLALSLSPATLLWFGLWQWLNFVAFISYVCTDFQQ